MHFTAILARKGWSFYTFLKGSELCLAISGAALTLLWPVCTNLIIPYYLWRPPRVFLSRCSLPHFCSLLLFNQPSSVSPAPLTSACLLTCLEWTFSLSSLSVGARQGVDGTSDVTLKMWLGWMAPLCRRGSGSSFQLCFDKHVFFQPADLRDRLSQLEWWSHRVNSHWSYWAGWMLLWWWLKVDKLK